MVQSIKNPEVSFRAGTPNQAVGAPVNDGRYRGGRIIFMRYHIDTIPVWDAQKLDGECLFCALERKTELNEAARYLGGSVMEPDIRVKVNQKGFCRKHHAMLFDMKNRLGHALMLESHTAETRENMKKTFEQMRRSAREIASASLKDKMEGRSRAAKEALRREAEVLTRLELKCIMCESISENMDRYLHTFFHLYRNDTEFRNAFLAGKGLCLPHLGRILSMAADELPARELPDFTDKLCALETESLDRIQEDISWFIRKFDYRFEKESWKNSRDAVERTVNKLRSWAVGEEPNPRE